LWSHPASGQQTNGGAVGEVGVIAEVRHPITSQDPHGPLQGTGTAARPTEAFRSPRLRPTRGPSTARTRYLARAPPGAPQGPPGSARVRQGPARGPPGHARGPPWAIRGPPGARQGPARARQGPARARQRPSGARRGPFGARRGPSGARRGPSGAGQGPAGGYQGPPGATRGLPGLASWHTRGRQEPAWARQRAHQGPVRCPLVVSRVH